MDPSTHDSYQGTPPGPQKTYRNTIGSIVAWALLRAALVVLVALLAFEYLRWIDYSLWWGITAVSLYAFVVHPIQVQYRLYREETRKVLSGTLCASCRHFEETGVLCAKLDEHVTEEYIPCDGELWEPKPGYGDDDE
ncbi:MAG: hypothetical protein HY962_01950 [Ignavibacteriae bacterium]|nr:hypothetical protein [Ignavibacteriota bacterium]